MDEFGFMSASQLECMHVLALPTHAQLIPGPGSGEQLARSRLQGVQWDAGSGVPDTCRAVQGSGCQEMGPGRMPGQRHDPVLVAAQALGRHGLGRGPRIPQTDRQVGARNGRDSRASGSAARRVHRLAARQHFHLGTGAGIPKRSRVIPRPAQQTACDTL